MFIWKMNMKRIINFYINTDPVSMLFSLIYSMWWFSLPPLCLIKQLPPFRQGLPEQFEDGKKTQPGDTPTMSSMATPNGSFESKDSLCPLNSTESMQACRLFDTGRLRLSLEVRRWACPPRTTWSPRFRQWRGPGAMPDAEWSWSRTSLA